MIDTLLAAKDFDVEPSTIPNTHGEDDEYEYGTPEGASV